jgi:lysosomal-associated membrane protein 1/2
VPTTQAPVPKKPDIGKWNVTDDSDNKTHILVEMAVQLNIKYDTLNNVTRHVIFNIPKNASAAGLFGNDTQSLNITWLKNDNVTRNQFIISFEKNSTANRYRIRNITVIVTPTKDEFPGIKDNATIIELYINKTEFSTPLHKSYHCAKEQTFDLMNSGNNETSGTVTLSNVHLEAFCENRDRSFDAAEDCEKSTSSDIVPIAVGCALVGLVAIVLIAYLVGRRRSQTRGYLSM